MVSRTREKLIEVARQLFAYKGVENTTMSDIATASDKGRRTIYTYFKSKREIYEATIERDGDRMVAALREEVAHESTPCGKLRRFLEYRLDLFNMSSSTPRGVSLGSLLHLDFNRMDKVHRMAVHKEKDLLRDILDAGVADGSFDPGQTRRFMPVIYYLMRGVDMSYERDDAEGDTVCDETKRKDITEYIINSLIKN